MSNPLFKELDFIDEANGAFMLARRFVHEHWPERLVAELKEASKRYRVLAAKCADFAAELEADLAESEVA